MLREPPWTVLVLRFFVCSQNNATIGLHPTFAKDEWILDSFSPSLWKKILRLSFYECKKYFFVQIWCRFQRYPEIINKAFSKNWSESTTEGLLLLRENGLVNGINLARIRSGRMEEEDKKIHAGWVTRKFCTIISNRRISRLIGTDSSFHWNYLYVKTVVTVVRHCCPWLICYPIIRELFLFTNIL